jgi:hypothetical protein
VGGQGMIVCNKKVTVMLLLHFYKIPDSPKIISQMKVSRWPDATNYDIHKIGLKL